MFETAFLKVQRASEHVRQLSEVIRDERPFTYILETNTNTRHRATFAKKNKTVTDKCALICGDAIHNLRTALDHAYFEIVSPKCSTPRDIGKLQFPFSKTAAGLEKAIQNRLAPKAGEWLVKSLLELAPHGEAGGNELLYLIHDLDVTDKHRLLIPAGDYTQLSADILRAQALDYPMGSSGTVSFAMNFRDEVWDLKPAVEAVLRNLIPPSGILEQELRVPVQVIFAVRSLGANREFIQTLNGMLDATKVAIEALREP